MSNAKKFGMFGGVFTPSILTILGVIMYMRLGWVVGNAGLVGTILIILVAHIISVSTGLSVSAIATDKKVGAGGVYYVLSRSLGLPMGGAIGITLFVATSLSISLYLVGFAESFNSYLGLGTTINDIRLTGTVGLLSLTTIALISTSAAMKTQFLIMAAIVASLVAIFFGVSTFKPETVALFGSEDSASFAEVFAIFFPAVTGFTAGIAMSGDLKNSKKSIPFGTLLSIGVGLIIYVVLAIFLSYMVNPEVLKTDNNVLMKISLFAPAVVAGIWGATLSSALGGILGGPRILQAMSVDRITPKLFAKGKGKNQEPWNALFLTVVIAEGGILIGELDVIAGVVSMFYLTAYGFINIAFFLESWASSDFNPSFKVKRWVGLVGGIATFIVMFKLDMVAMFVSFIVIGFIYYLLARKEVALGTGDIWQSVWSRLVKTGLKKIDTQDDHNRNWKPNVLLFSGGTEVRPHLIEFCQSLGGRKGIITNFDLIENKESKFLFPKHQQSISDEIIEKYGIFGRRQEVNNVFAGIEAIASTYGFNGIEPNTVFMGWARNTEDPIWFAQMTQRLIELDMNVLYLDYDEKRKFGNFKQIDIWWEDMHSISDLSLHLMRFLHTSEDWSNAEVKINYVNGTNKDGFEEKIREKLDDFRIDAKIVIHNKPAEHENIQLLVEKNSMSADLLILGIPEFDLGEEKLFVERTNEILTRLSSTLLIRSSTQLISSNQVSKNTSELKAISFVTEDKAAKISDDTKFAKYLEQFNKQIAELDRAEVKQYLHAWKNSFLELIDDCKSDCISQLSDIGGGTQELIYKWEVRLDGFIENDLPFLSKKLTTLSTDLQSSMNSKSDSLPRLETRRVKVESLKFDESDSNGIRKVKKRKLFLQKFGLGKHIKIPVKRIFDQALELDYQQKIAHFQNSHGVRTLMACSEIKKTFAELNSKLHKQDLNAAIIQERFDELVLEINKLGNELLQKFHHLTIDVNDIICTNLSAINASEIVEKKRKHKKEVNALSSDILSYGSHWEENQSKLIAQLKLELEIFGIRNQMSSLQETLSQEIKNQFLNPIEEALENSNLLIEGKEFTPVIHPDNGENNGELIFQIVPNELQKLVELVRLLPAQLDIIDSSSQGNFEQYQRENVKSIHINPSEIGEIIVEDILALELVELLKRSQLNCEKLSIRAQNTLSFISNNTGNDASENDPVREQEIKTQSKNSFDELSVDFEREKSHLFNELRTLFRSVDQKFSSDYILKHAEELSTASKANKRRKRLSRLLLPWREMVRTKANSFIAFLTNQRNYIDYQKFLAEKKELMSNPMQYADFSDSICLTEDSNEIPLFYRELYASGRRGSKEIMFNRDKEFLLAKRVLERTESTGGALAIVGDPLSGKSFFADVLLKEFAHSQMYRIDAPNSGNISAKNFRKRVLQVTRGKRNAIQNAKLQGNPIYIFENIELWWERSINGWDVIDELRKLMDNELTGAKIILTTSSASYTLLSKYEGFNSCVAGLVHLSPFSEENLLKVLFNNHFTGGVEIYHSDHEMGELSLKKQRKLIKPIHGNSNGNIGTALQLWIRSCSSNENGNFVFEPANVKMLNVADNSMDRVLLMEIAKHNCVTVAKLNRIFPVGNHEAIAGSLKNLKMGKLVDEDFAGVISIKKEISYFVHQYLNKA